MSQPLILFWKTKRGKGADETQLSDSLACLGLLDWKERTCRCLVDEVICCVLSYKLQGCGSDTPWTFSGLVGLGPVLLSLLNKTSLWLPLLTRLDLTLWKERKKKKNESCLPRFKTRSTHYFSQMNTCGWTLLGTHVSKELPWKKREGFGTKQTVFVK